MKEKIANLLRKWANKLAPMELPQVLSFEEYEVTPIQIVHRGKPLWRELPNLHKRMAHHIGEEMEKDGIISFRGVPTNDGELITTATAYVGVKKEKYGNTTNSYERYGQQNDFAP